MYNIREKLQESIKSNVPESVLFSGGIDSSAILYESKQYNNNVKAITIGIKENNSEDIAYSRLVASKINADLLICEVDRDCILTKVDDAVRILKSFNPEWISSTITLLLGIEYSKKLGLTKISSGEGADDLFGSFPFFRAFDGTNEELEYIMNSRYENIPVMTKVVADDFTVTGITPFRDPNVASCIRSIPLDIRMKVADCITNKYPLRMSYIDILPYESIIRPQTMAFTGSGVYDIIRGLEQEISDDEYAKACIELFPFKNKIEYALFKKYIRYYPYTKDSNGTSSCIHCGYPMIRGRVNCDCCQMVQYKRKELKFDA